MKLSFFRLFTLTTQFMISVYKLKPKFQQLLEPVLFFFKRKGITANQITIASILLSAVIGILFWNATSSHWFFLALPIGLLLRMALNALDGMLARRFNQMSKLGEILNEAGDVISDVMVFFPLIKFHTESLYWVVLFIIMSVFNEFCGLLGKAVGKERRYDGPMGKSDRALILGIYGILAFFMINIHSFSVYIFAVLCVLLVISSFIRLKKALR